MPSITDFLTPEAMRKIEALAVRSRYVVEGFRAGMHASPLKGASVEFADHRQYVKGDNLRAIDWKVFGRTERHFVKRYEEETSLRVQVIIDTSASMGYASPGQPTKYLHACRVAAALAYLVTRQQDAVGLTLFDETIREQVPPGSGLRHLRLIVDRLAAAVPRGRTHTGEALHALAETTSRRGLIVVMSDLFDDPDAVFSALAHFRKKLHDVILLQILDPWELDLPMEDVAEFVDLETGDRLELDPALGRSAYRAALQRDIDVSRERCAAMNVDFRLVSTAQPYDDFIRQYLAERRRMSL